MKQHIKSVIWPRGKFDTDKQKVYRYIVVGMIVTDTPIEKWEGKNEIVLDGPSDNLVQSFTKIKQRKSKVKTGDAINVLLSLDDI
jgi:hypothetical protein